MCLSRLACTMGMLSDEGVCSRGSRMAQAPITNTFNRRKMLLNGAATLISRSISPGQGLLITSKYRLPISRKGGWRSKIW
jgi:hypothetical protein